ncbi:MAG: N-6 DNA methylase [Candidatus Jorgensenbacteria bacterium]|nr:N-6 DNA methylase [Candidatus Jorgensenbacteria bacterium]
MLTQEIKKKIDSARDILVGKIPDPKAQVEQITTALIYKFMDDMDKESMSLPRGKAQFFTNGYEKYAWNKLMDPKLGGHDRLNLYSEAITKMSQNPHLQQLFRDIFKDAFLPFRDPETLNLFLKEINGFTYDHSENLGDAFEYLLSVLGSQGDAGQFRTPRHIIDFIVEVVEPKKGETILDPACGTAGFLVSAYKHILKATKDRPLSPDEKKRLMTNLTGYDISPDMVKLSRVNMYLHGFPSPNIHEYDTLTSEEKWNERFDVIMANPPFMTPKGGIRPHKRFMVRANRSEILFVDYITEHLNSKGKGAVIVPDGVVSNKNSAAYIALRKMLIKDDIVYAVVSLHPGVFKPYADVKTSILFFDKQLAKLSPWILFADISFDGFEGGNRKRVIEKNDIPKVLETICSYKEVTENSPTKIKSWFSHHASVFGVTKEDIKSDGDYILRGNKYKIGVSRDLAFPLEPLAEHLEEVKKKNNLESPIVFSVSNEQGLINSDDYFNETVSSRNLDNYKVVDVNNFVYNPARINVGSIAINSNGMRGLVSPMYTVFKIKDGSQLVPEYLYYLLKSRKGLEQINLLAAGAVRQTLNFNDLIKLEIPIPPQSVQVSFKHDYHLIRSAKRVLTEYCPYIKIDPTWQKVKLGNYFQLEKGLTPIEKTKPGKYPLVTTGESYSTSDSYQFDEKAIIIPLISSAGHGKATLKRIYYVEGKFAVGNILMAMLPKNKQVIPKFFYYLFSQEKDNLFTNLMYGTSNVSFSIDDCININIPKPTVDEQLRILTEIEKEQDFVDGNRRIIELSEQKIKSKIAEVWGE